MALGGGGDLVFRILADKAQFDQAIGSTRAGISSFASKASKALAVVAAALVAARAAFSSIEAFDEQIQAEKKLASTLRATGHAAGFSAEEIKKLAQARQQVTNFGDEMTIDAAGILATFKEIKGPVFKETITLAQDMSSVMGTDLKASVVQLGKALNDPIHGLTALTRVGVSFNEQQKEQIRTLQESGRFLEAQEVILAELRSEFGGAAEGMASDWQQLKNLAGDFAEFAGSALMPIVSLVKDITNLTLVPIMNLLKGNFNETPTAGFSLLPSVQELRQQEVLTGSITQAVDNLRASREKLGRLEATNDLLFEANADSPLDIKFNIATNDALGKASTQDRIDELLRQIKLIKKEAKPGEEAIQQMTDALRQLYALEPTDSITAGINKLENEIGDATGINKLIADRQKQLEILQGRDPFDVMVDEFARENPGVLDSQLAQLGQAEQAVRDEQQFQTLVADAEALKRSLMTPFELFDESVAKIETLGEKGLLDDSELSKALLAARDDFEKSIATDPEFIDPGKSAGTTAAFELQSNEASRLIADALSGGRDSDAKKQIKNLEELNAKEALVLRSSERIERALAKNGVITIPEA